ncbi:unnamed protein product, partial [Staurois parvus]
RVGSKQGTRSERKSGQDRRRSFRVRIRQEADRMQSQDQRMMQVQGLMENIHQGTDHRPGPV